MAAAINDDASYASTLTTALSTKTDKTSNQSLGTAANVMTISGNTITLARGDGTTDSVVVPDNNTVYSHPTYSGDDFSVDSGALSGATVVSDIDINVSTDTNGHVTDANGVVSTRNLTLANLGYTGAPNANYLTLGSTSSTAYRGDRGTTAYNHSQVAHAPSNANYFTYTHPNLGAGSLNLTGAAVLSNLVVNVNGHVTSMGVRNLTAANIGAVSATLTQTVTGTKTFSDGLRIPLSQPSSLNNGDIWLV